jgi:hypothetical protein
MRTNRRKSILTNTSEFCGLFCVAIPSVTHDDFIRKQFETATNRPKNILADDPIDRVAGACLQRSFDPQAPEQMRDLIEHSQRLPLLHFTAEKWKHSQRIFGLNSSSAKLTALGRRQQAAPALPLLNSRKSIRRASHWRTGVVILGNIAAELNDSARPGSGAREAWRKRGFASAWRVRKALRDGIAGGTPRFQAISDAH